MANKRNHHGLTESGVFYRDRDEWMRYVASRETWDASARLICLYIALKANPESREPFPRQSVIAEDCGVSTATVKRAVRQAVSAGLLAVTVKRAFRGRKPVNHYRLVHPAD